MAWPATPLTSYNAGLPPAIKAFDLNAFQSAINGIVLGTYSLKALYVDGTGGAVITALSGTVGVTALLSGTTAPTTAYPLGTLGRGTVVGGWAVFDGTGALLRGYNVRSCARTGGAPAGDYTVTFIGSASDPNNACAWASIVDNGVAPATCSHAAASVAGDQILRIRTYDMAGAKGDRAMSCGFFSE